MGLWLLVAVGCAGSGHWWWASAFAVVAALDCWLECRADARGDFNWMDFPC